MTLRSDSRSKAVVFLSTTIIDKPPAFSCASTRQISARTTGARPSVASSSTSRLGLVISARPSANICCSPPDNTRQRPGLGAAPFAGRGHQVFLDGQRGKDLAPFRHQRQPQPADPVWRHAPQRTFAVLDAALAGGQQAEQALDDGAAAHPVAADQSHHLPCPTSRSTPNSAWQWP
ncbi:hypothetical protein G6F59_013940 [Rhizopus arrhizus]|nr:hypothetical protein G6F59_013940 [Rhizopus arrhizus]